MPRSWIPDRTVPKARELSQPLSQPPPQKNDRLDSLELKKIARQAFSSLLWVADHGKIQTMSEQILERFFAPMPDPDIPHSPDRP